MAQMTFTKHINSYTDIQLIITAEKTTLQHGTFRVHLFNAA